MNSRNIFHSSRDLVRLVMGNILHHSSQDFTRFGFRKNINKNHFGNGRNCTNFFSHHCGYFFVYFRVMNNAILQNNDRNRSLTYTKFLFLFLFLFLFFYFFIFLFFIFIFTFHFVVSSNDSGLCNVFV